MNKVYSIDDLISRLEVLKELSQYGGDTTVCVSLPEVPYVHINRVVLEQHDESALVLCGTDIDPAYLGA